MVLSLLLLAQPLTGPQILAKAKARYDDAKSVTVTTETFIEKSRNVGKMKIWLRKDGYYRYETDGNFVVATPKQTYSVKPSAKSYYVLGGTKEMTPPYFRFGLAEFDHWGLKTPVIGSPKTVTWHGRSLIRVEADAKAAKRITKLYFFFDPKTYDHLGTLANLGSITQVLIFRDLKLNPTIPDTKFVFSPPKGWKLLKQ